MADDDWAKLVDEQDAKLSQQVTDMRITQPSGRISIPSYDAVRHGAEIGYANGEQNTSNQDDDKPMTAEERSYLQKLLRSKLVQTKNDIEIQRKDPNSPLYSIKSFEELNLRPELLKGIYAMGFNTPSKIQETALPTLLADPPQNMIAQSQSGTGKTAAFVLALLSRVDFKSAYPQALCLSPTYELALQTGKVVEQMGQFIENMSIAYAVRGERVSRGQKISSQIVIGTPGTVLDWTMKFHVVDLKRVRVFVLDEADVMIATQGHQDQSTRIHRGLNTASCQMMLFSATYDQQVMNFAEAIISSPMTIRLRREEESLDNIKQYYVVCGGKEDKFQALANIYGVITVGQAMIFCHTRNTTNWLAERMIKEGHAVALLNGDMQVDQRVAVLDRFRDGKEKVLITTNVCARGIDVEQVNVVVNYDLPMERNSIDCETYLHRIGRTGRFGKTGLAINLIQSRQMPMLHRIQEHFGRKIEKLDTDDADELENLA